MEPSVRYTLVGTVVLALMAGLLFAVLWLFGATSTSSTSRYLIYFQDHSLSGLQVDGNVTMRGIKVGSVEDFQISRDNIENVKVLIELDSDTPVKVDTEAIVTRNLLTGLATIELVNSSQASPLLESAQQGQPHPVIKEGKAPLERLAKSASSILENVDTTLARINDFLSDENLDSLSKVIQNLENLSTSLARGSGRIEDTIAQIDSMLEQFSSLSKSLNARTEDLTESLQNSLTQLLLQLSKLTGDLTTAARSFAAAASALSTPKSLLFGPSNEELGPGESR